MNHLIFATGYGGGFPNMPDLEGKASFSFMNPARVRRSSLFQDIYDGTILHSSQYKSFSDFTGKKAVVVGACNSGENQQLPAYLVECP